MVLSIVIPIANGDLVRVELDTDTEAAVRRLGDDPTPYFATDGQTFNVPLACLVQTRVRPDGVANAAGYMIDASEGRISPREPITVDDEDAQGLHRVIDGNSTVTIARAAGWTWVPCRRAAEGLGKD